MFTAVLTDVKHMLNWLYVLPHGGEANEAWHVFHRARVFVSAGAAASTVVSAACGAVKISDKSSN